METGHGPIARRVFDSLRLPENGRYLDIGCGNGYTVRWAAAAAPGGFATGLDLSPRMIARARELSAGVPNVEFVECAFPAHGLPDASFDAIFSMEVLYYVPDPVVALRAILRLLKPGASFASAIDLYRENRVSHGWIRYVGVEMKMWDARRWKRAFERAGFEDVEQEQMILKPEDAVEKWHASVGSLVTRGRRPRAAILS